MDNLVPPTAPTPITTTNLDSSLWHFAWRKYGVINILVILLGLLIGGGLATAFYAAFHLGFIIAFGAIFGLAVYGAYYRFLRITFSGQLMAQFAQQNGYTFLPRGDIDQRNGAAFSLGQSHLFSSIVSGTYAGHIIRFFLYEFTIGGGRDRSVTTLSVFEIDLDNDVPTLLMANHGFGVGALHLQNILGTTNRISLEGDFDQHFDLYAEPNDQVSALEVFTPDVMQLMESDSLHLSVEFSGNRIHIYKWHYVKSGAEIAAIFALAQALVTKIAPVAARMNATAEATGVALPTQDITAQVVMTPTEKKALSAVVIIFIILFTLPFVLFAIVGVVIAVVVLTRH